MVKAQKIIKPVSEPLCVLVLEAQLSVWHIKLEMETSEVSSSVYFGGGRCTVMWGL